MRVALLTLVLAVAGVTIPVSAQAVAESYHLNIPRQPLDAALKDLAQQTGVQIARFSDTPGGSALVGPVDGDMTVGQALNSLLTKSGLTYRMVNDHTIAVVALTQGSTASRATGGAAANESASPTEKEGKRDSSQGFLMAQATVGQGSSAVPVTKAKAETPAQLEEIIVTAERREESVQKIPVSITAISGADIQDRGIENLFQLALFVPGVSMRTSGPGQTEFEMRGMSSVGGNSPTVGFYLDDVSLTAPATTSNGKVVIDPNLYDLNRIEVLRGPQGTLYGAGSMGGTIKVVTNPPNPAAFDASAEGVASDTTNGGGFNYAVNAMLNLPFGGNTAALRVVATDSHTSGWMDRIVIADGQFPVSVNNVRGNLLAAPVAEDFKGVNNADLQAVRGNLLWTPTEKFDISASYFYQHISQNGASYADSVPGTAAHYQPFDSPEPFSDNFNLGSLNFRYRFDSFDLTSTTSQWHRDVAYRQDGSEEWQWVFGLPSYYTYAGGIGPLSPTPWELDTSRQFTEELRLTSTWDRQFKWLVGYYYSDFTSNQEAYMYAPGAVPLFGTSNVFSFYTPTKIVQNSFFGEFSYNFTPQLKGIIGARRYSYSEEVQTAEGGFASPTGGDSYVHYHTEESNSGLNPKFSLSYEASEKLLLYGTIAKGFRPGGGTGPIPTSGVQGEVCEANLQAIYGTSENIPTPLTFNPDSVWNYEIGEKWKSANNRVLLNSAVYFADWKGIQQVIPLQCGYNFTANAGDAHVYGGEVEFQAFLGGGFELAINFAYTHATLVSSNVTGVGVDPGTRIQQVPEHTTSQWLAYRHQLSPELTFTGRIENSFEGSRTDATYAINTLPGYDLTSLRFGVESHQWSAALFVTNVLNKKALLNNATMIGINLPQYNRTTEAQPLTFGLDLNYRFGR